jgi:hypothetical protein|tara:strand:- start:380 stop:487 length:108 start_codon:yes stop_codon:yes gene_type:complete
MLSKANTALPWSKKPRNTLTTPGKKLKKANHHLAA